VIDEGVKEAESLRAKIQSMAGSDDTNEKARLLKEAEDALDNVRLIGDLAIAAFFGADNRRDREQLREKYEAKARALGGGDREGNGSQSKADLRALVQEGLGGAKPVHPFHWETEFPEAFSRPDPGFDAFVGNPPFLEGMRISSVLSDPYKDHLYETYEGCGNRADLVAFFFRRSFALVRNGGCTGLIATNTIAQGDTRSGGLGWICANGGSIYAAIKRLPWPGLAAVVVSIVHISKGKVEGEAVLNGLAVPRISAFLLSSSSDSDPFRLREHQGRSYKGTVVLGMGFTFDDEGSGVATPLAEMERIVSSEPLAADLIRPYIGGAEVVSSPTHQHRRFIIDFDGMSEEAARRFPTLFEIVKRQVKPERDLQKRKVYRDRWWQFAERQTALYDAVHGMDRVLVIPEVCPRFAATFLKTGYVYGSTLYVMLFHDYGAFALLQSRIHESWARHFGSSMKDDLRYVPSDCFETFPFPEMWQTNSLLDAGGKAYPEFRATLMVRISEGLTNTYNRFHDKENHEPDIIRLRELHDAMDRAVLDAYGWTDLKPTCEFILDYEEDEDDDGKPRRKKKPWRYRWPDEFRDEVLARLLALNQERAAQEKIMGGGSKDAKKAKQRPRSHSENKPLFE
jgi:hypothetical protein